MSVAITSKRERVARQSEKQRPEQLPTQADVQRAELPKINRIAESVLDKNRVDKGFDIRDPRNQQIVMKVAGMTESGAVVAACQQYIQNISEGEDTYFSDGNHFISFIIHKMGGRPGGRKLAALLGEPVIGSIEDLMSRD